MITLLTLIFFMASHSAPTWGCYNNAGTCTNGTSVVGEGCRSPGATPKICYISVATVGCYRIFNSTGVDKFIPTKTAAEFANFVASPGAGMTATLTNTIGSGGATPALNCYPSCWIDGKSCNSPAGSSGNPP
jgi:hypothetical protein